MARVSPQMLVQSLTQVMVLTLQALQQLFLLLQSLLCKGIF